MTIRRVSAKVEIDVVFDIDERHIDMMLSDEWQGFYYCFEDRGEVLEYVARCMALYRQLDGLDGHANLPEDWAPTKSVYSEISDVDAWNEEEVAPKEPT